ncbi:glycosyltransferase family 2 protein [Qipengyuania aquimaris]|uniref:Glycosyltransferase n=1 Tax=Qipengyuania aquimaris TaxID=255984 RepID=A0A9Q3XCW4_9SPHN|nr:glycosyltransferase family 2 protein [Qipengyuania aquimaris]MBY6217884.1 glycosyltransferase [Qipengyuania aquimaris]
MKISIITAVFNRVGTIAQAMKSVQAQNYPLVEHVVQDGGSTDGTTDLVAQVADESTKLVSARDSGIYDAINLGIRRATGDVIGLMHSDDFYAHDGVLSKVVDALADPSIAGVYGDLHYVSAENPDWVVRHWRSGHYEPSMLNFGWMPPHPTLYLRREVFEQFGLYDTSFSISADYDAMLRYLVKGQIKLAYIPEVLVKMRLGGESNRSLERILRKSREDLRAIRGNKVGGIGTLAAKNLRKLGQFIVKGQKAK